MQTKPLVDYYAKKGLLRVVDAYALCCAVLCLHDARLQVTFCR
jgi:hypothetical protein